MQITHQFGSNETVLYLRSLVTVNQALGKATLKDEIIRTKLLYLLYVHPIIYLHRVGTL